MTGCRCATCEAAYPNEATHQSCAEWTITVESVPWNLPRERW